MGRRKKSTKKIQTRKKQVVSTVFKCPFCSHDEAVECKMYVRFTAIISCDGVALTIVLTPRRRRRRRRVCRDRDHNIGHLSCRVCTESFQTPIHCTRLPLSFSIRSRRRLTNALARA